jgi:hypothetical protein
MADLTAMLQAAAGAGGEYQISRSLRFNSADSAYLSRTPASASNRKTWTWSGWVKRSKFGDDEVMFSGGVSDPTTVIRFSGEGAASPDGLRVFHYAAGFQFDLTSTAQFRDPSAWYHILVACDTTQATSSNRIKIYVNGVQVTAFDTATYPSLNYDTSINNTVAQNVGRGGAGSNYLNGYLTEINCIDGQALTPTSFGKTNATTGAWSPIAYAGSYGTNGFYLNFSDNTSTTTLGEDQAGSNDWTLNNFSVTAGAGNDSLVDVPTRNTEDVDTGAGGEVRGNYCTGNPLNKNGNTVLSNGNLNFSVPSGGASRSSGTLGVSSGKWYFEATRTDAVGIGNQVALGVMNSASALSTSGYSGNPTDSGATANEWALTDRGTACNNTTYTALSSTIGTIDQNDVVQVCIDMDAKKIWFGIANTFSGSPSAGTGEAFSNLPTSVVPLIYLFEGSFVANFGQRPFAYTAPSGFKALVTTNLPQPTVVQGDDYFNTVLYTGTGSSLGVTGVGFQPDWVWIKERSGAADHGLYDAVRGTTKQLESNNTDAETTEATGLTAFGSDGFTVGALAQLNTSADTYVAWNWKANGAGVSNTDGTISSTVSVSTTSGFSIVEYTKLADGNSVGHGLGVTPAFIIQKITSGTGGWLALHQNMNAGGLTSGYLLLNTTDAFASNANVFTAVTSTTFTVGSVISNADQIVYCFAEVEGFSKIGSYTGNNSTDGPFVYTGMRPAFVLIKNITASGYWVMFDVARNTYNAMTAQLWPNGADAEDNSHGVIDAVSNGFKLRNVVAGYNDNASVYIYMAFASNPFKYSLAR